MDFSLSDEQKLLVDSVRQFGKKSSPVERFRRLRDAAPGWEKQTWALMGELGWHGLPLPEEAGGFGGSMSDVMLVVEELGRALVPEPYVPSVVVAGMTVAELGTREQREAILGPLVEGQTSLALAHTEAGTRFDPARIALAARRDGDDFVLEGEKRWVPNGHAADTVIVAARTSGQPGDESGLTLFVVPGDAIDRQAVHAMDGHYTGFLRFEKTRLSADAVLGEVDAGHAPLERALDRGALCACAEGLGIMRELLARTVDYLKTREQFGVPIGSFQALQHRAVDMHIETEMMHSMVLDGFLAADAGDAEAARRAASAAKVQLGESGWFVAAESIQLHGGIGCSDELDVGLYFKRMRVLQTLYGDADWHLDRVARSAL